MDISEFKNEEEYVAQMNTGALLNPRVDSTFKALFSQPTPESRAALRSFLEAATERKITKCTLSSSDAPVEFIGQRGVSYDILCEFADGLAANIEMQAFNQAYDYGKRAEYQVARLETTYLRKGEDWEKAPTVYQITVLDFSYEPKILDAVSRYAMRTKDGRELSGALNVIFIELPKVKRLEENLDANSALENWAVFLKDVDNPKKQDLIQKLTIKEEGLMQAKKSLSSISEDRNLWIAQYRQEIADRDRRSSLAAMQRKGLEEGRKKGLKEGREKGLKEGRAEGQHAKTIEVARNLKEAGIDFSVIAKSTGLSIEEIEKI